MAAIERVEWARDWRTQLYDAGESFLRRAGDDVLEAMRTRLPASQDGSNGHPPGYARSRLRTLETGRMASGEPYRDVGTDATTPDGDSYPAMLEHGTKPHVITPRQRGYPLRDPRTGRVFGYRVEHPGTRPIPWARTSALVINGRVYR